MNLTIQYVQSLPYIGSGVFSNVYDAGKYVIKVPMSFERRPTEVVQKETKSVVKKIKSLRKHAGNVVTETWWHRNGFIIQPKVSGLDFADLPQASQGSAANSMERLFQKVYQKFDFWDVDENHTNFFFHQSGKIKAWFDPVVPSEHNGIVW